MKNIIVGIDFSASSLNALKHAIAISIKTHGRLHLVWVKTPSFTNKVSREQMKKAMQKVQKALDDLIVETKREVPKNEVLSVILDGKTSTELTKYAANFAESIIVIGTHGMSGQDVFAGSNAMKAVGLTTVPILILREDVKINRDLVQILVPIDSSFETLQKMKFATRIAKAFAAKILLLGLNNPPSAEIKHTITVQLQHASTMCKDAKIRHAVTAVDVTGNATEAIINYAQDKDINLIVVMREEEDDFSNFWVGSDTRRMVNTSPMPIVVIPNVNYFAVSK
jgi:nucleotide-binding universal stress UspA family protein